MDDSSGSARQEGDSHDHHQQEQHGEQQDGGHSGEGAASALAHLKSQARHHRQAEADDAAGAGGHGE